MSTSTALLSTAYFAPVQYYSKFLQFSEIFIEQHENYNKQSYRNRCTIMTANGLLDLSVPIERTGEAKVKTKDVRIDNSKRWKIIHWRAIESAYRSSPFFIYYADEIHNTLFQPFELLLDMNNALLFQFLDLLKINTKFYCTNDFKKASENTIDLSDLIHPKQQIRKPDSNFYCEHYYQVFELKFGFSPNLSIIDLLFNMGPSASEILKKSIRT